MRAEFVPLVDGKDVGLICRAGATQFAALVGAYNNKVCGFELFGEKLANVNTTATRRATGWLTQWRRHELVVQVRKEGAAIIFDGTVVCPPTVGYSRLSLDPSYRLKSDNTLGSISASPVRFDKVEIFEITGTGKDLRAADSKPAAAEADKPEELPVAMQKFPEAEVLAGNWRSVGDTTEQRSQSMEYSNLVFGDIAWSDYDLTLEAKAIAGLPEFTIVFQATDVKNWRQLKIGTNGKRIAELTLSRVGRFETRMVAQLDGPVLVDRWYKIKIEVRKTHWRCEVGGKTLTSLDAGFIKGRIGLNTHKTEAAFRNIEVRSPEGTLLWKGLPRLPGQAPTADKNKSDAAPPQTYLEPTNARHVDLLKLIDPSTDAVAGDWMRRGDSLISESGKNDRIECPYTPPEEYDLIMKIVPKGGEAIGFVGVSSLGQFAARVGGWGNQVAGFELVDGKKANNNASTNHRAGWLTLNRPHELALRVRKAGAALYFNSLLASSVAGGYHRLTLGNDLKLRNSRAVGILSFRRCELLNFDIYEITGEGTPLRP